MDKFTSSFLNSDIPPEINSGNVIALYTELKRAAEFIENQAAALATAEELIATRDQAIDYLKEEAARDAVEIIRLRNALREAEQRNALQQRVIEQMHEDNRK